MIGYQDGPLNKADFCAPSCILIDPNGIVLVVDSGNHSIRTIRQAPNPDTQLLPQLTKTQRDIFGAQTRATPSHH